LDTGDMLLVQPLPITSEHTAASLHDELAVLGAQAVVQALAQLESGGLVAVRQQEDQATYAAKLEKSEAPLDFTRPAQALARRVRAFNPVPGATLALPGIEGPVKVWRAQALPQAASAQPGAVESASAGGIDIATVDEVLRLLELQKAGGKRQPAATF